MVLLSTIWAITLRYLRLFTRDLNIKIATFYWPLLDIVLWGFLGVWIQQIQGDYSANFQAIILLCIVLWQVTVRSTQFIFKCFLEELWAHNLITLFSLPISLPEWIASVILYSGLMTLLTVTFCISAITLLYHISLWYLVKTVLLFAPPLFISGVWIGFMCLQSLAYFGKRADEVGWVISWVLAPFSAAFYPPDVLPTWAQAISAWLPMSYAINGMRNYLTIQTDPTHNLLWAYCLSMVYAAIAIVLFAIILKHTKKSGLVRLFD